MVQADNLNEGVDENTEEQVLHREEDENDDSDEETITPENLPALDSEQILMGKTMFFVGRLNSNSR